MSESGRTESERAEGPDEAAPPKIHLFFRGERLAVPPEIERKCFEDAKRESEALNHEN